MQEWAKEIEQSVLSLQVVVKKILSAKGLRQNSRTVQSALMCD